MRGRVDKSRGLIAQEFRQNVGPGSNLIQKAEYNQAIIRTFRIVERSPSPTFGDVVHPVCIIEDLRDQVQPAYRKVLAGGRTAGPPAGEASFVYVRNAGTNPNDRVVVDRVMYKSDSGQVLIFRPQILRTDFGATTTGEFGARILSPATDANFPTSGTNCPISGFTVEKINPILGGGGALTGSVVTRGDNQESWIEGPIVLKPDHCCVMQNIVDAATLFYVWFYCTEIPGS